MFTLSVYDWQSSTVHNKSILAEAFVRDSEWVCSRPICLDRDALHLPSDAQVEDSNIIYLR